MALKRKEPEPTEYNENSNAMNGNEENSSDSFQSKEPPKKRIKTSSDHNYNHNNQNNTDSNNQSILKQGEPSIKTSSEKSISVSSTKHKQEEKEKTRFDYDSKSQGSLILPNTPDLDITYTPYPFDPIVVRRYVKHWTNIASRDFNLFQKQISSTIKHHFPRSTKHVFDEILVQYLVQRPQHIHVVFRFLCDQILNQSIEYNREFSPFYAFIELFQKDQRRDSNKSPRGSDPCLGENEIVCVEMLRILTKLNHFYHQNRFISSWIYDLLTHASLSIQEFYFSRLITAFYSPNQSQTSSIKEDIPPSSETSDLWFVDNLKDQFRSFIEIERHESSWSSPLKTLSPLKEKPMELDHDHQRDIFEGKTESKNHDDDSIDKHDSDSYKTEDNIQHNSKLLNSINTQNELKRQSKQSISKQMIRSIFDTATQFNENKSVIDCYQEVLVDYFNNENVHSSSQKLLDYLISNQKQHDTLKALLITLCQISQDNTSNQKYLNKDWFYNHFFVPILGNMVEHFDFCHWAISFIIKKYPHLAHIEYESSLSEMEMERISRTELTKGEGFILDNLNSQSIHVCNAFFSVLLECHETISLPFLLELISLVMDQYQHLFSRQSNNSRSNEISLNLKNTTLRLSQEVISGIILEFNSIEESKFNELEHPVFINLWKIIAFLFIQKHNPLIDSILIYLLASIIPSNILDNNIDNNNNNNNNNTKIENNNFSLKHYYHNHRNNSSESIQSSKLTVMCQYLARRLSNMLYMFAAHQLHIQNEMRRSKSKRSPHSTRNKNSENEQNVRHMLGTFERLIQSPPSSEEEKEEEKKQLLVRKFLLKDIFSHVLAMQTLLTLGTMTLTGLRTTILNIMLEAIREHYNAPRMESVWHMRATWHALVELVCDENSAVLNQSRRLMESIISQTGSQPCIIAVKLLTDRLVDERLKNLNSVIRYDPSRVIITLISDIVHRLNESTHEAGDEAEGIHHSDARTSNQTITQNAWQHSFQYILHVANEHLLITDPLAQTQSAKVENSRSVNIGSKLNHGLVDLLRLLTTQLIQGSDTRWDQRNLCRRFGDRLAALLRMCLQECDLSKDKALEMWVNQTMLTLRSVRTNETTVTDVLSSLQSVVDEYCIR